MQDLLLKLIMKTNNFWPTVLWIGFFSSFIGSQERFPLLSQALASVLSLHNHFRTSIVTGRLLKWFSKQAFFSDSRYCYTTFRTNIHEKIISKWVFLQPNRGVRQEKSGNNTNTGTTELYLDLVSDAKLVKQGLTECNSKNSSQKHITHEHWTALERGGGGGYTAHFYLFA